MIWRGARVHRVDVSIFSARVACTVSGNDGVVRHDFDGDRDEEGNERAPASAF